MRLHTLVIGAIALHAGLACAQPPLNDGLDRSGFDPSVRAQDDLFPTSLDSVRAVLAGIGNRESGTDDGRRTAEGGRKREEGRRREEGATAGR